jgi:hypothetical protein
MTSSISVTGVTRHYRDQFVRNPDVGVRLRHVVRARVPALERDRPGDLSASQVTVVLAVAVVATWSHGWHTIGHFFTALGAVGLTGVLALVAAARLAGGFATIRRITV